VGWEFKREVGMEFLEAVGFVHFWGYTPGVDIFRAADKAVLAAQPEINILLTGTSDIRHIMKTLAIAATKEPNPARRINVLPLLFSPFPRSISTKWRRSCWRGRCWSCRY
jgi:hypothetical protein